jgi:hypothetical protein
LGTAPMAGKICEKQKTRLIKKGAHQAPFYYLL